MEDKSIIKNSIDVNATYINDCIKEVCLKGDSLTKYKRMIEKQYGAEFYQKCGNFVKEVKRSVKRGKFTQTSLTSLQYLANEIGVSSSMIDELVNHFTKKDQKVTKTPVRRNKKQEKKDDELEEKFVLYQKVAKAEHKRLEREAEAKRLQEEEEERKRLQKKEEHRQKEAEGRRQKKEVEEKQRREEEEKAQKEEKQKIEDDRQKQKYTIGCITIIVLFIIVRIIWPDVIAPFFLIAIIALVIYGFYKEYLAGFFE